MKSFYKYLILSLLLTFVIRIILSFLYFGGTDSVNAKSIIEIMLSGYDPRSFSHFPYSNLGLSYLHFFYILAKISNYGITFWMETGAIIGDLLTVVALYYILRDIYHKKAKYIFKSTLIFVLNPVSIIISAIHGQLDPIAVAFVLFAGYFLVTMERELTKIILVSFCLMLAVAFKVYPALLFPAFIFHISRRSIFRTYFVIICGLIGLFIYSPYLAKGFNIGIEAIKWSTLGYGKGFGQQMGTGNVLILLKINDLPTPSLPHLLGRITIPIFIILAVYFVVLLSSKKANIFPLIALTYASVLAFHPKIAAQYTVIIIPFYFVFKKKWPLKIYSFFCFLVLVLWYCFSHIESGVFCSLNNILSFDISLSPNVYYSIAFIFFSLAAIYLFISIFKELNRSSSNEYL